MGNVSGFTLPLLHPLLISHVVQMLVALSVLSFYSLQPPASAHPSPLGVALQRSQERTTILFSLAAPMASRATQSEEEPASHRTVSPLGPHPALSPFKLTPRERRAELPPSPDKKTVHCLPFFHEFLPTIVPAQPQSAGTSLTKLMPHPHTGNLTTRVGEGVCSLSGVRVNSSHPPRPHSDCFLCRHDFRGRGENRASSSPHNIILHCYQCRLQVIPPTLTSGFLPWVTLPSP